MTWLLLLAVSVCLGGIGWWRRQRRSLHLLTRIEAVRRLVVTREDERA